MILLNGSVYIYWARHLVAWGWYWCWPARTFVIGPLTIAWEKRERTLK